MACDCSLVQVVAGSMAAGRNLSAKGPEVPPRSSRDKRTGQVGPYIQITTWHVDSTAVRYREGRYRVLQYQRRVMIRFSEDANYPPIYTVGICEKLAPPDMLLNSARPSLLPRWIFHASSDRSASTVSQVLRPSCLLQSLIVSAAMRAMHMPLRVRARACN